ncbi:hypothetical protein BGZ94_004046 [Podila epigama]|nr:hypothetical protein BGZ94_004046 [Podila epigama]
MHFRSFIAVIIAIAVASTTATQAQLFDLPEDASQACKTCTRKNIASVPPCPGLEGVKNTRGLDPEQKQCFCSALQKRANIWYKGCEDECTTPMINLSKGIIDMYKELLCSGITTASTGDSAGTLAIHSSKKTVVALGVVAMAAHTLL